MFRSVFATLCSLALLCSFCIAQSDRATMSGRVTDPTGAVIPAAEVTATNLDTNVSIGTKTNDGGIFVLPALKAGRYRLVAKKDGFSQLVKTDIVLNVQDEAVENIVMKVGSVSEMVNVVADQATVNTTDATVSTVVNRQFVENLPLNGRTFQSLIQLAPGVVVTPATIGDEGQFSVNGQRTDTNYFAIDGVSANIATNQLGSSTLYRSAGGSLPGFSVIGGTNNLVSVDALQEFRIQTSSYAPEYGRTPGAQISITTRSGTNQLHGNVFEYLRNDVLDASDWFANHNGLPKPKERQNDFGGVLGGPIIRNRTFFFASYEGQRLRLPQILLTQVPSTRVRQSSPTALQPYLNVFPQPNGPETRDGSGNLTGLAPFNASFSNQGSLDAGSIRIDHTINEKLTVFGRFNYSPSELVQRAGGSAALNNIFVNAVHTTTATGGLDWLISPLVANQLRINFSRNLGLNSSHLDTFGGAVIPADSVLYPPSATNKDVVQLTVTGAPFLAYNVGGKFVNTTVRQINITDNVSFVVGSHTIKVGGDYRWVSPELDPYSYINSIQFSNMSSFLAGKPLFVLNGVSSPGRFAFNNTSVFAQDQWKASARLTLTYGLRWEVNPPPSANKQLPAVTEISDPTTAAIAPAGTPLWHTSYANFAPRLGVAYQLHSGDAYQTIVRGGFGVFYDLGTQAAGRATQVGGYPYGGFNLLFGVNFPLAASNTVAPPVTFTTPASVTGFDPHLKLPYTLQWNAAIEQALGNNQTLSLTYLGSGGRRLQRETLYNKPNATFSTLYAISNGSNSDYDALQIQFLRRLSRGLQASASYTWSHSIDDASASFIANTSTALSQIVAPGFSNRGSSDFDIRHAFSGGLTYDIPKPKYGAVAEHVLGGWSLDNILQIRSAPPLDVTNGATIPVSPDVNLILRPDLVSGQPVYLHGSQFPGGKALNFAAFALPSIDPVTKLPTHQGNLARNSFRGFGAGEWDMALRRQFPIRERLQLQFRAELFNILNHPNFGQPVTNLAVGAATFGKSTQMLGRSLGQSFGTGLASLYQLGGPRTGQLALKVVF